MKLVMPLGKEKVTAVANFDIDPQFGCACSMVDGRYLTAEIAIHGGNISDCLCYCAYGNENQRANYSLGYDANEWYWPNN